MVGDRDPLTCADGGSRREVVGQDNFVPVANALKQQLTAHQADHEEAARGIAQAQNGVSGADGYGSVPLSTLRQQHAAALGILTTAQQVITQGDAYRSQGGTFTGPMLTQYRQALETQDQYGSQVQGLQTEIATRENAVTQGEQLRDGVNGDRLLTQKALAAVVNARNVSSMLSDDLATVLRDGTLPPAKAAIYQRAGLIVPSQDGTLSMVSGTGVSMLPKDAQSSMAADLGRFNLDDATKGQLLSKQTAATPALLPGGDAGQAWQGQQQALLNEIPDVARPGTLTTATFIRAFQRAGNDPRKALQVARAVLGVN